MIRLINRYVVTILIASFFVIPLAGRTGGVQARSSIFAPLLVPSAAEIIADQYLVVYKAEVVVGEAQETIRALVAAMGGEVQFTYRVALNGYSAYLPGKALEAVRADPAVEYVEADAWISLDDPQELGSEAVQNGATWGLDRVDQRSLPLSSTYKYKYTGKGVHVYVIDSGIRSSHTEFGMRASKDFDSVGDGQNGNDCNGHGTHMAGTVGGTTYGVAKQVRIHAVRVLNCAGSGSISGAVAGMDWVAQNHQKPAIAITGFGGSGSSALDTAVNGMIKKGILAIVGAGGSNSDACNYSPARVPNAITVGASDISDSRTSFSNWGTCLDLFAPGSNITSAWHTNDTAINTISSTSMASPHVAGVAALYLQTNRTASVALVRKAILDISTRNRLSSIGTGSPNRLLYSMISSIPTPLSPKGTITDRTPTYRWSRITAATKFQIEVYQGTTKVLSATYASSVCVRNSCSQAPARVLAYAAHKWRVRAFVGGVWKPWSAFKNFTVTATSLP